MRRSRHPRLAATLSLVAMLAACGDDRGAQVACEPGGHRACACPDGATVGSQACTGGVFDACTDCGLRAIHPTGDRLAQYVIAKITLPVGAAQLAYDLDGDGHPDDALGSIVSAVDALALAPQAATDAAVASGQLSFLLEQISTDAAQQSATNAGARLTLAVPPATTPRFDGGDEYVVDPNAKLGEFVGDIVAGVFTSQDPASTLAPIELTLALPLVQGEPPLLLPLVAARVTFKHEANGRLSAGQLNGAIRKTDLDGAVLPTVAKLVTQQLALGNASGLATFDSNGDHVVTAAELAEHPLIQGLLAPDVAIFDSAGAFNPDPHAPEKDCISLGVGFTAVTASF